MDLRPTGYKPKKQLLCISVTGNLNTLLYLAELHRLICRGKRNRTSDNGSQSIKRICCKLPSLDASKIRRVATTPFPKFQIVRLQVSNLRLPPSRGCAAATPNRFYEVSSLLITHPARLSFSVLSNANYSHCADAFMERVIGIEPTSSAWRADALTVVLYPHNDLL